MSAFEVIVLFLSGSFVGSIASFGYIYHVMINHESDLEMRVRALDLAYRNNMHYDDAVKFVQSNNL